MKTKLSLPVLCLALALLIPQRAAAQAAYLGGLPKVTTLHADTNYFIVVIGIGTNAVVRNINSSNALEVLRSLVNWPGDVLNTNGTAPSISTTLGVNTWSLPWASAVKSGLLGSNANDGNRAGNMRR